MRLTGYWVTLFRLERLRLASRFCRAVERAQGFSVQSERLRRLVNALILPFVSILPPISLHFDSTLWPAAGKIALPTKGLRQFFLFSFMPLP
ncbi:hypothetical protein BJF92_06280 [Rhizobium rhizosphaerae]|uniref:Uncharacterized protein n=1 Tax=Xaviernesmea rhizosphaerae TaxID=1672749 RepID=A0A1Q9AFI6_9HYPH|nr:hypothetical protein BJF92_06280 [Xaviernesmea rhizosphaerae]